MIQVQDWAEIRHLYFAEELSQRAIAERLGVARKTVRPRHREWPRLRFSHRCRVLASRD